MKDQSEVKPSSFIPHPSSFVSRWRNTILGTLLVLGGVATAFFTIFARHLAEPGLAGMGAIASLLFALLITILVVPPLARSAYAEVASRGLPLEVTTGGVIFIVILVVVALAAWNTGNNLLFLVFSIMLSTLFVSWAAARLTLRDLTVSARFPDHIFAGEPAEVLVTIRNEKRVLPSFSVLVEARGPADWKARKLTRRSRFLKRTLAYFTYIPHRAAAEQSIEQMFRKRGHVLVTGFELSTRFPFGFFRHRRRLRSREVDIVVYPKPQPIADELHLLPLFTGQTASFRRGFGHDLLLLRDYQQRDDLRHIDWKATARARRLTVREFTAEDERRITILLDTRLTEDIDRENFRIRFENGVVQAASLVKHFIDERAEVSLVLGTERTQFATGLEQLYACLRKLALVQPAREVSGDIELEKQVDAATKFEGRGETNYLIILTASARGNIPPSVWRRGYVIFL
ncbi:MAG TPA: DUF58 domain-containing protein [Pyrinomonadaceae bacterium]|jgi:uncharacterized protein (DUF58 family)|nr:DUF58 domain-containing protein [Pyrinomonadaceae bacterium]